LPSREGRSLVLAALLGACSQASPVGVDGAAIDAAPPDAVAALPAHCLGAAVPPDTLECTGLYADLASKRLADGVRGYAPAIALWSDGADKHRWVSLPAGATIDTSNPSEWLFPVGTKFWKEFSQEGRRVETRLWQKVRPNFWVAAAYAWNADETAAMKTAGGDIPFGAGTYHIPTQDECEKCHRGRNENILGFEAVELGLPGASGITLADLAAEGRLSSPPSATRLTIGDDGTGTAAPALGWLHANCGITCHNGNSNAVAYPSGLRFRLDPAELDGRSSAGFDALRTSVGIAVNAPNWRGQVRVVPGDPDASLLHRLIANRGPGNQMPPIASRLVDQANVAIIREWIRRLPPLPARDAGVGVPDAGVDAGADAAAVDAAAEPDAGVDAAVDAGGIDVPPPELDASAPDAAAEDAPSVDAEGDSSEAGSG
jgi:hypothetical protein